MNLAIPEKQKNRGEKKKKIKFRKNYFFRKKLPQLRNVEIRTILHVKVKSNHSIHFE